METWRSGASREEYGAVPGNRIIPLITSSFMKHSSIQSKRYRGAWFYRRCTYWLSRAVG